MQATYRLIFELQPEAGSIWSVRVPHVRIEAAGRSLAEARRNVHEALAAAGIDVAGATLEEDIRLTPPLRQALQRVERAREKVAAARAIEAEAARELTASFSLRDVGDLLGISQEGVRRLVKAS